MKCTLAALALLFLPAAEATALTLLGGERIISAEFRDPSGDLIASGFDTEMVLNDAPFTRNLSVFIGGGRGGFEASVGMQPSGFFGIEASTIVSGTLQTRVGQTEIYRNDTALPMNITAEFLIVEGLLELVAGTGSNLSIDLLSAELASGEFGFNGFDGSGVLTSVDFVSTYAESGDPLNGVQAAPGGPVTLPSRLVTVDFGQLAPGESFSYVYSLGIVAAAPVIEFGRWVFVDPSAVAGVASPFTVTGTPVGVTTPVPLPATALLLVSALALLAARARRAAA